MTNHGGDLCVPDRNSTLNPLHVVVEESRQCGTSLSHGG